ncbi:MAG: antitoxin AF2212-like protein [Anaerolineae bacterium]
MVITVKAVYRNGAFQPLEEVEGLRENQQVMVMIIMPAEEPEPLLSMSELAHLRSLSEKEIQTIIAETPHDDLKGLNRERLLDLIASYEQSINSSKRPPDFASIEATLALFSLDEQNRRPLTEEERQRRMEAVKQSSGLVNISNSEAVQELL